MCKWLLFICVTHTAADGFSRTAGNTLEAFSKICHLFIDLNQMRKALSKHGNETLHLVFVSITVHPWCLRYFTILNFSFLSHYREPPQLWNSDPGFFAGLRPLWYRAGVRTVFLPVPLSNNIKCSGSFSYSEVTPFCLVLQSKLKRKKNNPTACVRYFKYNLQIICFNIPV